MYRAIWNGKIIAETNESEKVEGNIYFPPTSIRREFFKRSSTHTTCGWKGVASYYHVEVDGKRNEDAAWYYPDPKGEADNIRGYVAFQKGVEITST